MKKQLVLLFLLICSAFYLTACVSSLLKDSPPTFSKEINYKAPPASFVALKTSVFPSWKNSKSGNVISLISECETPLSSNLQGLHRIVEDSLTEIKVVHEENTTFQNKPAYAKKITAQLDGLAIETHSISFKRKSCGYVTTLSGKAGMLEPDQSAFEQFKQGLSFE